MTFWNIFIFLSVFHEYAESYHVSEIPSQWAAVDTECAIAVPPIRHTPTGIVVDVNTSLLDTEHAWVGYIKTQKSFDYIGCFQQKSLGILQSEKVEVVSPGQCFDVCHNRSTVGVSGNECFCLNDSSSLSALRSNYTICTTECESKSGVVCGYRMENGSKYISIYKEHKLEAKDISARNYVDAHCLRLDRDQNTFAWDKCSEKMLVVCDFGPTCIPTSSDGLNKSWIENTNVCFLNRGLPLRVKNCSDYNGTNPSGTQNANAFDSVSPAWTSFIRSYVINSTTQTSDIFDSGIIQYGYVQKQGERIVLNFTKNRTILNKILCTKKPSPKEVKETPEFGMFMYTVVSAAAVLVTVMVAIFIALICRRKKRRHKNLRRNSSHYDNPVISFTANDEDIRRSRAYETIGQNRANQYDELYQHNNGNHMQTCPDNIKQEEKSPIQLACGQDKREGNNSEYERIDDFPRIFNFLLLVKLVNSVMTLLRFKMSNNIFIITTMLLLFRGFQRTRADVEYYISRNTSTWEAASKECNLATPPIDFINLSLNISNIEITEDLWVGFYIASLKIEFVGCVHEEASHRISPYSGNSATRCFSSCGSAPYFGLSSTRCYCSNTRPINISRDLVCELDCNGRGCSPCERNGYMTLYKIYTSGVENARFINTPKSFYEVLRRMCPYGSENGETSIIKHVVQRTYAIFKYNGTRAWIIPKQIPSLGYIDVSKDQILLKFEISSQKLRALCVKDSEAKTTEEDNSSLYIGVSIAVAAGVTSLAVLFVVILKRRNSIPKFCRNDESIKPIKELESTQKGETSHRGIDSIGHMNPAFNKSEYMNTWNVDTADDNYDSSHYSSIVEEPRGKVNQPIESQSVKIPDVQHLHAKMESNLTDQNATGSDKGGSPFPHYFILEKIEKEADDPVSTKDLTRIEQKSVVKDNERNVYNTLNEAKIEMSDNVYDITEKTANKGDTTYDTTRTASSQRNEPANYNSVVIGDDEYSHTGKDQIKYSKTDNVYGMQDQQGIHVQQFDKEDLENSETYNHLNMTKFNKNKTDNLYGFSKN